MSQKSLQYTDSQVVVYISELHRQLRTPPVVALRERLLSCTNVSERASAYMDALCSLGSVCFRWYGFNNASRRRYGERNVMEGVYCFTGRIWEQVDGVRFKIALKDFCLSGLGMTAQEWIRSGDKYVLSVRDGAMLSPLEVSRSIVGFSNGVYDFTDMRNIVCHPFSDRMPVTELLGYDYDERAKCRLWLAFLGTTLGKKHIELLQRYFSLGLVDREKMGRKVESTLWLVGPGGVGKSTILNVMSEVFGRWNVSSASMGDLLSSNSVTRPMVLSSIVGKVFNMCGEVQAANMSGVRADGFKSLCSGEPQPVRGIGRDYEMRSDIPYMVFSMNGKPKMSGIDNAILRRILFVPFRSMIREEDRDPELGAKLLKELPGIRNWLMEGYRKLEADNFRLDVSAGRDDEEEMSWMEENGQTVGLFLAKSGCRPYAYAGKEEKGRWFPLKILHARYEDFCKKHGYEAENEKVMGIEMTRDLHYRKDRRATGVAYMVYGGESIV